MALTRVPEIKFLIFISAGKFGGATMGTPELAANAFSSPIERPSLHFIGNSSTKNALQSRMKISVSVEISVLYI